MMHAVIPDPLDDVVLECQRLQEDEDEAKGEVSLEGSVGPKAMRPGGDADHA